MTLGGTEHNISRRYSLQRYSSAKGLNTYMRSTKPYYGISHHALCCDSLQLLAVLFALLFYEYGPLRPGALAVMATDEEDIKLGAVESFDGLGALRSRDRASGLAFALGATTSRILSRDDSKKEEIDLKFTEARKKAGATAAEAEDSGSGDTGAALVAAGEAELDQHFFRRLWSYLDKDGGGAISKDEIGILFTQLGQDSKLADELWTLLKGDAATSDQIEVDDFLKIVTTSRERMIGGKIVLWLVQYVLMFLYTFTTRMPFIFLAPEIQARGGSLT